MQPEESLETRVSKLEKAFDKHSQLFQVLRSRIKTEPEIFGFDDMAQQIIGAALLSSPFCTTEEVWRLADSISLFRAGGILGLSVMLGVILIYFTDYQKVADHRRFGQYVPIRIISLICVSYGIVAVILSVLGVFNYQVVTEFGHLWRVKVVVLVGFFAILGGAIADVIR
ncbi:MAG: DUF2391 family protein [Theionarchaea archaeon]|nr:DUF2391 family protein [Theionarchaea archaeon]MBU7001445.1 DUF2391 family protein [Theionarchaea archaeon]MBU7022449.1 DUF2391 family protein [Theionarchaea archaeon]MBU7036102.1 DUF2391 family protein [Theionarchaea archaeon]MBU7041895.1 DUF2391 family protein [Theionarchaea archaeon]